MGFKANKRTNKDGSVTYWTRVDAGSDPITGKRLQPRLNASTVGELKRLYADAIRKVDQGGYTNAAKQTVAEYMAYWLDTYAKAATKPRTYDTYALMIKHHITPAIGHVRLDKLTPTDLATLYRQKLDGGRKDSKPGGLSPRTVRYIHATIREALAHAMKWGIVHRNVADAVDAPKLSSREMTTWNAAQVTTFLAIAEATTRYAPVFMLAVLTGLRRGELLAVRWRDIDLDRGILAVRQTLVDRNGTLSFSSPKTHRSSRPVDLPESAIAALKAHRRTQLEERLAAGPIWQDHDLVFATDLGRPIHPRNLFRAMQVAITKAKLPPIRFHDLRHTHATLLFQADVHPKIVSERLGHATIGLTLDVYSHTLPGMQREAASRLDAMLTRSKKESA